MFVILKNIDNILQILFVILRNIDNKILKNPIIFFCMGVKGDTNYYLLLSVPAQMK